MTKPLITSNLQQQENKKIHRMWNWSTLPEKLLRKIWMELRQNKKGLSLVGVYILQRSWIKHSWWVFFRFFSFLPVCEMIFLHFLSFHDILMCFQKKIFFQAFWWKNLVRIFWGERFCVHNFWTIGQIFKQIRQD